MFINTENKLIWKNGAFQKWDDTNVHILSHTLHYGTGVFEGVRAYDTLNGPAIFRLKEHTNRLFDAAKKINIEVISTSEIKISVLINKKNLKKSVEILHQEFKLNSSL